MKAMAERAVKAAAWRLKKGMVGSIDEGGPIVVVSVLEEGTILVARNGWQDPAGGPGLPGVAWWETPETGEFLPDLSNPATLGCLLALIRKAWDEPVASVWAARDGNYWEVTVSPGSPLPHLMLGAGSTEEEAMVAALEAAP